MSGQSTTTATYVRDAGMTDEELDSACESAWLIYLKNDSMMRLLFKVLSENEQCLVANAWQLGYRQCLVDSMENSDD